MKIDIQKTRYDKELKENLLEFKKDISKLKISSANVFLDDPEAFHMNRFLGKFIKEINLKGKNILDYGCGTGELSTFFGMKGAKYTLGLDISEAAIEIAKLRAKANNANVDFKVTDPKGAIDLQNITSKKYNYIFFVAVLHHLTHKQCSELFGQLKEILFPDGLIFINEPIAPSDLLIKLSHIIPISPRPSILTKKYKIWHNDNIKKENERHERILKRKYIIKLLKDHGFKITKIHTNRFFSQFNRIIKIKLIRDFLYGLDNLVMGLPILKSFARNLTVIAKKTAN